MLKMYAVLDGKLNGQGFAEYKRWREPLAFESFNFTICINGVDKEVNFDWPGWIANVRPDGTLLLEEGRSTWFGKSQVL